MEFFSDNTLWVSFFLAVRHCYAPKLQELLQFPSHFLVTQEVSATTHKETQGEHFHILFVGDDVLYRKLINTIKKHFPLQGVAKNGVPRQYGKVRDLRDPFRMASYMLKQGKSYSTDFPDSTISTLKETSFEKSQDLERSERETICAILDEKMLPQPTDSIDYINHSVYALPLEVKTIIIETYRSTPTFKYLTSHRLKYLTQYYLMYHKKELLSTKECLDLFF